MWPLQGCYCCSLREGRRTADDWLLQLAHHLDHSVPGCHRPAYPEARHGIGLKDPGDNR